MDYSFYNVLQLKKICTEQGYKGCYKLLRQELLDLLQESTQIQEEIIQLGQVQGQEPRQGQGQEQAQGQEQGQQQEQEQEREQGQGKEQGQEQGQHNLEDLVQAFIHIYDTDPSYRKYDDSFGPVGKSLAKALIIAATEGYEQAFDAIIEFDIRGYTVVPAVLEAIAERSQIFSMDTAEQVLELFYIGYSLNWNMNDYVLKIVKVAARDNSLPLIKVLFDINVEVDIRRYRDFILNTAATNNYPEMTEFILDYYSPEALNSKLLYAGTDPPLITAAENGSTEVVKLLLEKGVQADINDNEALRVAIQNGHLDTAAILLQ